MRKKLILLMKNFESHAKRHSRCRYNADARGRGNRRTGRAREEKLRKVRNRPEELVVGFYKDDPYATRYFKPGGLNEIARIL